MFHKIIEEDIRDILSKTQKEILQLEGKSIVITGAAGMLASYLVYTLLYANKNVFATPATLYLVTRHNTKYKPDRYIKILNLDISKDLPSLKNPDYIIHAASKAAPKFYNENKVDTLNTNILGLYNLLKISSDTLKSFLFFSSADAYGHQVKEGKVTEGDVGYTNHLDLRSCYREGKRIGETICMNYFWEKKLPVKIARIFHTFGPGLNLEDGRVFSDFIKQGLEKKDIVLSGDPTMSRSFLYVKDATIMFLKLLTSNKNGEIYNVGNDENDISVKQFAEIVSQSFKKINNQEVKVISKKDHNIAYYKQAVKSITPDISKFTETFSYIPQTKIQEAVKRTIRFYLNN